MMKKTISFAALMLAILMLTAVLAACGGSDSTDAPESTAADVTVEETQGDIAPTEAADITGTAGSWGAYTVLIPDGYELKEGGEYSSYDFSVRKSDFKAFDFNTEADDDNMMQHYNYNKETYINEQIDVAADYDGTEWTGFQYSDGFGGYGFEAYTTLNGKIVRVSGIGFTFDSAEAEAVLESFGVK